MYTQIITFRTVGMTPEEFAQINDWAATQYAGMPGLVSKIFLADPDDDHAYGGVYLWQTREHAERYLQGELIQTLANDPRVVDVHARVLAVVPGPTSITGGPLADLAHRWAA